MLLPSIDDRQVVVELEPDDVACDKRREGAVEIFAGPIRRLAKASVHTVGPGLRSGQRAAKIAQRVNSGLKVARGSLSIIVGGHRVLETSRASAAMKRVRGWQVKGKRAMLTRSNLSGDEKNQDEREVFVSERGGWQSAECLMERGRQEQGGFIGRPSQQSALRMWRFPLSSDRLCGPPC